MRNGVTCKLFLLKQHLYHNEINPHAEVMNKNLSNKIETVSLEIVHEMAIESLPPDLFEKWEEVREAITSTRMAFTGKQ